MKNTLFYILKVLLITYFIFSYTLCIKAKIYNNKSINIYSDIINIYHNKLIILLGHVFLQKDNNTIYSDKIILEYITLKNNENFLIKVTAIGHVIFFNKINKIIGNKIKLYFSVYNIHINSRYNIIKIKKNYNSYDTVYNIDSIFVINGKLYLCSINRNNNIIIYGSKIIYNSYDKIIKIWHAKFKLNSIPIFYSPYLSFTYNNKLSYFGILLPNFSYDNKGIKLNIPYRLLSNLHSYEIIIVPSIKQNIFSLKNKFNYLYKNYHGSLELSFVPNQEKVNSNLWLLYWFNTLKKNDYQLDIIYNKSNNYDLIKSLNIDNYFNNKIIRRYCLLVNNKNINSNILYEKFLIKNNNYNINSFFDFYYYKNLYNKLIDFVVLGQFTRYNINNNILKYFYIIPKLNYLIPTKLGVINLLFNLNTIYKNKNIDLNIYNKINNLLNNNYIHVTPEININWHMIIKLFINNHYRQLIKPTIEYQYNVLNNNFNFDNFYKKNFIYYNNIDKNKFSNHYLFEGFKTFIFNNNIEKLYFSLGKIHYILFNHDKYSKTINNIWFNQNITNFKNKFFVNSSTEFIKSINNIVFNNTKIRYKFANKRFLTINYYYLNLKHLNLNKLFPFFKNQIGINFDWIINKNWTVNSQNNFDIKNNNIDSQFFNVKYENCHFNFIIKYEYKLTCNKISNNLIKKNNNHFSFNINISN
ncbi:MAG: hypothetical protein N4P91_00530 [Candidatus Lightella neohaematopini]|nr:hypothetical protein [Candidatus Lightella neohaematopini]